ncbi:MAG: hypothetical protein HYT47_02935 [Candidatus Vogelbacteria bacterium]|nr:hypothetical protein [Candidatus Vogelbacteria bacterium]
MKTLVSFILGMLAASAIWVPFLSPEKEGVTLTNSSVSVSKPFQQMVPELVVGYNGPDGKPLELIYNPKSQRVILRVDASSGGFLNTDELERLKIEVMRLVSVGKMPVPLGDSGISFKFVEGQYPIWGPHHQVGPGYRYRALLFAERAVIKDGVIEASGLSAKPEPGLYYPYHGLGMPTGF